MRRAVICLFTGLLVQGFSIVKGSAQGTIPNAGTSVSGLRASSALVPGPVLNPVVETQTSLSPLGMRDWASAEYRWLQQQVTPNTTVPDPEPSRRGLLLSYAVSPETLPYGYSRSTSYDNALAALVFMVRGERARASGTLNALARVARPDGSLWFGYNTTNDWPSEKDHDSALVRAGAIGWVGYAFTFYLSHYPACANEDRGCERERTIFLQTSKRAADYLLTLQVRDPHDSRNGLIRLGIGDIRLTYRSELHKVVEVYSDEPALGISTENNISAWFFLRELGKLTSNVRYTEGADRIRLALIGSVWNDPLGQFNQGFHSNGDPDARTALDCATWGAIFLTAAGETEKARKSLALLNSRYSSRDGDSSGLRPYAGATVYEDPEVENYYFPGKVGREWKDLPLVWSEGSLGAALAFLHVGRKDEAVQLIEGLRGLRVENGGLLYASRDLPFQMIRAPGVAASAWLILVVESLNGNSIAEEILR